MFLWTHIRFKAYHALFLACDVGVHISIQVRGGEWMLQIGLQANRAWAAEELDPGVGVLSHEVCRLLELDCARIHVLHGNENTLCAET